MTEAEKAERREQVVDDYRAAYQRLEDEPGELMGTATTAYSSLQLAAAALITIVEPYRTPEGLDDRMDDLLCALMESVTLWLNAQERQVTTPND